MPGGIKCQTMGRLMFLLFKKADPCAFNINKFSKYSLTIVFPLKTLKGMAATFSEFFPVHQTG